VGKIRATTTFDSSDSAGWEGRQCVEKNSRELPDKSPSPLAAALTADAKGTRRHVFLQTISQVMPWQTLLALVEPLGDKAYVGPEATIQQKAPKARNCIL